MEALPGRFNKVSAVQTLIPFIKKLFICQFLLFFMPLCSYAGQRRSNFQAAARPASSATGFTVLFLKTKHAGGKKILNMITYFLLLYIISHIMKLQLVKNTRNFVTFEFMTCPRIKRIVHRMRMKLKQLAGDTGQASKLIKFPFKLRGMLSISGFPTLSLLARAQSVGLLAKIVWRELDINVYDSWPTDLANFRVVSEVQIMAPNQRLFSKSFLYCRRN